MQNNSNDDVYDIVIIGGGAAGLAAGLYAARARMKAILLERLGYGGQLLTYESVENYPGFPDGVTAFELAELFKAQASKFGLETVNAEVIGLRAEGPVKTVEIVGRALQAKSVIIATGASPRKVGVTGEREFTGRGVSYCAVCDGPFYKNQEVAVVGGGDTAVEEAIYLTKFASKVYLIHRRPVLRAAKVIQERALRNEKIEILWKTIVSEIHGGPFGVEYIVLKDIETCKPSRLPVTGIFVFVGLNPNVDFIPPAVQRDRSGFIVTDAEMATSVPGVFAAGDIRSKELRQIVTAVGDGATAAYNAGKYIEAHFSH